VDQPPPMNTHDKWFLAHLAPLDETGGCQPTLNAAE